MVIQPRCCGDTAKVRWLNIYIAKVLWLLIVQHQAAGSQGSMEKIVNYLVWMFFILSL